MIYTDNNHRPTDATDFDVVAFGRHFSAALRAPLPEWVSIVDEDDCTVQLLDGFMHPAEADRTFGQIAISTEWRDDTITLYGKTHAVPRRHQWFADSSACVYTFSGITMQPQAWSPVLERVRHFVQLATGERFNAALVNLYVDGGHTVGWHSDDEVGVGSTIASVSLGATRDFVLRRVDNHADKRAVKLVDGSLLVMRGKTQEQWQHALPRRKNVTEPRINVTFRQMAM